MIKKGTMIPAKKMVGWTLIISGIIFLFNLNFEIPRMLMAILMLIAGYFLAIAGRQK